MKHLVLVLLALAAAGCSVAVRGGPLSSVPQTTGGVFLSTSGAPRPARTVGFVQVRGYGVQVAGVLDVGDAALDHAIRGVLTQEAQKLGGDGVVNIEFLDENPSTPAEQASAAVNSLGMFSGRSRIENKERYVTVTGEVIQFL